MPSVERLRQVLLLAAVLFAAAAAWRGGTAFFRESPADAALLARPFPPAPAQADARREDRTLESFRAVTGRRLVPAAKASAAPSGPPPFLLLATVYDRLAPQDATAVVRSSKGDVHPYRIGETVKDDDAKLLEVVELRACFLWRGEKVWLGPDGASGGAVVPPPGGASLPGQTEFTVSPEEWKALYGSAFQLMTQVRVQINMVNGQPDGLRILSMENNFPGRRYGLQPSDVVRSVNGAPLTNLGAMEGLLRTFAKPQPLAVEVDRGGRRFTLTIKPGNAPAPAPVPPKP